MFFIATFNSDYMYNPNCNYNCNTQIIWYLPKAKMLFFWQIHMK
jgi:hypothetical protein